MPMPAISDDLKPKVNIAISKGRDRASVNQKIAFVVAGILAAVGIYFLFVPGLGFHGVTTIGIGLIVAMIALKSLQGEQKPHQLVEELKKWVDQSPESEKQNREVAVKRIIHCFEKRSTSLNLQKLNLTSLPSAIGYLNQLKKLNLGDNHLATLPPEIRTLTELRFVYLGFNRFTTLKEIDQLNHSCIVFFENDSFSPKDWETVKEKMNDRNDVGPKIMSVKSSIEFGNTIFFRK